MTKCQPLTAPKKNGGRRANINSCATNKHCACRQFSVPKLPRLLAANRYLQPLTHCQTPHIRKAM